MSESMRGQLLRHDEMAPVAGDPTGVGRTAIDIAEDVMMRCLRRQKSDIGQRLSWRA
jgi:hypothetical protein